MTNIRKLKATMFLKEIDTKTLASKCGLDYKNLLRKLRENNDWSLKQVQAVSKALELTDEEFVEIFKGEDNGL